MLISHPRIHFNMVEAAAQAEAVTVEAVLAVAGPAAEERAVGAEEAEEREARAAVRAEAGERAAQVAQVGRVGAEVAGALPWDRRHRRTEAPCSRLPAASCQ